jgi:hypothetical protein
VIVNVLKLVKFHSTKVCRLHDVIYASQEMYTRWNSSCTFTLLRLLKYPLCNYLKTVRIKDKMSWT